AWEPRKDSVRAGGRMFVSGSHWHPITPVVSRSLSQGPHPVRDIVFTLEVSRVGTAYSHFGQSRAADRHPASQMVTGWAGRLATVECKPLMQRRQGTSPSHSVE